MLKNLYKKFVRRFLASLPIGILIYLYILTVFITSRRKIIASKNFNMGKFQSESSIYAFWHGRMTLMFFMRPKNKKTNIFISEHADGKIIGNVSRLFNVNIIWGSSNKNTMQAIKKIFSVLKEKECLAITPDGPRGPAFEINSNIVKISSKYSLHIIPWTSGASKKKVFSSWDKFILPLPFGKLVFVYGNPIKVPPNVTDSQIKKISSALKRELNAICEKADNLVNS